MDRSPPRSSSWRLEESADGLHVEIGPLRALKFLVFWLVLWTIVGLATFEAFLGDPDPITAVWLVGWAAGEALAALAVAWTRAGREILVVAPDRLEVRQELGRFTRVRRYDAAQVTWVGAVHLLDEETGVDQHRLALWYGDEETRLGEGLDALEAESLAGAIRERLRAYRLAPLAARSAPLPPDPAKVARRTIYGALMFLAVMATVAVVDHLWREEPPRPREAAGYESPERYAAAHTRTFVRLIRARAMGQPRCDPGARWDEWSCLIRVLETRGPYPGIVEYRCLADSVGEMICAATARSRG